MARREVQLGASPGGALARFSVRFSVRHGGSTGRQDSHLIFSSSEQFSTNLLAKNTTVSDATNGARLLVTHLKSQRTESSFECFYESVLKASSELTDEPCLHRFRKRPKWFDNGSQPHQY